MVLPLYLALMQPHLEYCVQLLSPYYEKILKSIQRTTKLVKGPKGMSCEERLRVHGLANVEKRRIPLFCTAS